ncbi:hypothetical protein ACFQZ0_23110 [Streptomyces erythrogriseus]
MTQELGAVTSTLPAVPLPAVPLPVLEQPAVLPPQVVPGLPALPDLPGLAGLPAHLLPAPTAPGAPAHAPAFPPTAADTPAVPAAPVAHGPRPSVATPERAPAARHATPASRTTAAPPQAPAPTDGGEGDGALGSRSSANQGTARHVDAGAVPAVHRPVPRLVPGAAAPAETPVRASTAGTSTSRPPRPYGATPAQARAAVHTDR